jgi:hypothetical protein
MLPNGVSSGSGGGGGGVKRKGYDGREDALETIKAKLASALAETEELKAANNRIRNDLVMKHDKEVGAMRAERAVQAEDIRELEVALDVKKNAVEPPSGTTQHEVRRLRLELKQQIEEHAQYKKGVELRRVSQGILFIAELNTLQRQLDDAKVADDGKISAKMAEVQRQADERVAQFQRQADEQVAQIQLELDQSQLIESKLTNLLRMHDSRLTRSLAILPPSSLPLASTSSSVSSVPSASTSSSSLSSVPAAAGSTSSSTSLSQPPLLSFLPPPEPLNLHPIASHGEASRAIARCVCVACERYRERDRAARLSRRKPWVKVESPVRFVQ